MSEQLLEMSKITKRFPGVHALKGVDFSLRKGEVHALLGENGAGKSTLMKVLGGIYQLNEGSITIGGNKVDIKDVNDAKENGVSIIHQEIVLVPYLTIAENIFLGKEPLKKSGFIDMDSMIKQAQTFIDNFDLGLHAKMLVSDLTVAQQQMIEIIKAVSFNSEIIVMDEPTSSLTDKEVDFLFKTIKQLKEQNVGIVYISHRMNELFEVTDRITVMRDGEYIDTVNTNETTNNELISMMVGRDMNQMYERTYVKKSGQTILSVQGLTRKGVINDVSFSLEKGEILGFSGLVGAGRSEVMKCIFGIDEYDEGEIFVNGKKVNINVPNDAISHGIAYVPENRKEEGLFLIKPVDYNITIKILHQFMSMFQVNKRYEDEQADYYIKELSIKTPNKDQIVNNLSGGNQQKVLFSKWLATKPNILILDEPTRGVDVGAKSEIYTIMNQLVEEGVSIIMVSSELPEIINMSDRVAVMYKGSIQKVLEKEAMDQETIMYYATGGN
ncbi:sugar ABC transporter ATP-binding protein [Gracilibacillus kekensis]|uniref:sugar ABC transporter ATP-binding protein n=1 Tax=Gracilibacillus kekensis TaxID=1027249 RepID=UPI000933DD51|nr:sugar ABC transporter ATP-binding protein [Gracilibacillus kekensis]